MNDKRREQALAVYCEHNTGNANANYYEMRDSAVASMLAFARDQMAEKDAEIARLREDAKRYRWMRERHHENTIMDIYNNISPAMISPELLDAAIDAARKDAK